MYFIILTNEYTRATKTFTRLFPNKIGDSTIGVMEVFQLIDAEINEPLRQQSQVTYEIEVLKYHPFDYPQGHWYRDQMTNPNLQTR